MESWRFSFGERDFVLRRAPSLAFMEDRPFGHDTEAAIIRAAHAKGVTAPRVIAELEPEDGSGAGFVMARGLLAPGTYPRGVAFLHSARQGLKLIIGLVPIFMAAGLLESFVTRYTEMPTVLSVRIIGASAAFLLWYFVALPIRCHREDEAARLPAAQAVTEAIAKAVPAVASP